MSLCNIVLDKIPVYAHSPSVLRVTLRRSGQAVIEEGNVRARKAAIENRNSKVENGKAKIEIRRKLGPNPTGRNACATGTAGGAVARGGTR